MATRARRWLKYNKMKNIVYTILFAGILGPSLFLWVDSSLLRNRCMPQNYPAIGYLFTFSIIGMVIWMLAFRDDSRRRTTALVIILIAIFVVCSSTPVVMK